MLALSLLQKMSDDWGGNRVDELRARIVTQKQTGELVVFDLRNRVAVFAILDREADSVSEKLTDIDRVMRHLDRGDQTFSRDESPSLFQLPRRQSIADDGIAGNIERRDPVEEIFLTRLEKRQVRFVID